MKTTLLTLIAGSALTIMACSPENLHKTKDGFVKFNSSEFYSQEKTEIRKWEVMEDSLGTYIQILPDTRVTHSDKFIPGENFTDEPGLLGVITYKVKFDSPGRYYVWVSLYSTGSEDNGVHVGVDGQWPESGKRMQWCDGKNGWAWASQQRVPFNHCGIGGWIYLDIDKAGIHDVQFSMREDGVKIQEIALTKEYDIRNNPEIKGNIVFDEVEYLKFSKWSSVVSEELSKSYYDANNDAFAINTLEQDTEKWSAMTTVFNGESRKYLMRLTTLLETDGECDYRVEINGNEVLSYKNPRIFNTDIQDYTPNEARVADVELKDGDKITVYFKPNSNKLIPENDAFAFARARWVDLTFE